MTYAGFYINLDDSVARRAEVEGEIARYGLQDRYRRFPAVKGNALGFPNPRLSDSEIGVFTSHYQLLKDNAAAATHLHILEDDVVFSRFTEYALRWVIESRAIDEYDIIFTDTFVALRNFDYQYCKALYERRVKRDTSGKIATVRFKIVKHVAGMNSYIVNRRSIAKLIDFYARKLFQGPSLPVDLAIRNAAEKGELRTGVLFPFATSVRLERTIDTTVIGRRQNAATVAAAWLGRHSFFVDSDIKALQAHAERLLQLPTNDAHHELLARVLAFSLTNQFRQY